MAAGRVALGVAILAAPERVTARWLGAENAALPAVGDLARGLAARDIALGLAALSTVRDARLGARLQLSCALADAGDVLGTVFARRHLPRAATIGTIALAGGSAAFELALARALASG